MFKQSFTLLKYTRHKSTPKQITKFPHTSNNIFIKVYYDIGTVNITKIRGVIRFLNAKNVKSADSLSIGDLR